MMSRLFWTQPSRRWMVRLAMRLPSDGRLHTWIVDHLYPSDCTVTFPAEDDR